MVQGGATGGIGHLPRKFERDQVITSQRKRKDIDPMVRSASPYDFRGHVQRSPCAIPWRHKDFGRW